MKQRLSLKGRGLQLLAQREHSRLELRRKLLAHARAEADAAAGVRASVSEVAVEDRPSNVLAQEGALLSEASPEAEPSDDLHARVDAVLDWLQAHRYLSEDRFVESRLHVRAARFGNLRIRQELAQHGVEMSAEAAQALRDTELARAHAVWQRKFGRPAADGTERARQTRFLAGRGFSGEVIRRVVHGLDDS